jgi:hypothetical protein
MNIGIHIQLIFVFMEFTLLHTMDYQLVQHNIKSDLRVLVFCSLT